MNRIVIVCLYPPGRKGEKEKETDGGCTVISNAKTIPSSNRCRESLDISAVVFVVYVASARCAISNYLPIYIGMHEQFLFQPVRNARRRRHRTLYEQQQCPSCRHYTVKLTFRFCLHPPLKKKQY